MSFPKLYCMCWFHGDSVLTKKSSATTDVGFVSSRDIFAQSIGWVLQPKPHQPSPQIQKWRQFCCTHCVCVCVVLIRYTTNQACWLAPLFIVRTLALDLHRTEWWATVHSTYNNNQRSSTLWQVQTFAFCWFVVRTVSCELHFSPFGAFVALVVGLSTSFRSSNRYWFLYLPFTCCFITYATPHTRCSPLISPLVGKRGVGWCTLDRSPKCLF